MKINPINTNNSSTSFKAHIQPTQSLKDGFDMIERSTNSVIMKEMNYVKDFIDSITRISESTKIKDFKIEIEKGQSERAYAKINGLHLIDDPNEKVSNIQGSYLVVEETKKYASTLEPLKPSVLDDLKTQIEAAQRRLNELKVKYSETLMLEFKKAKQNVFGDIK